MNDEDEIDGGEATNASYYGSLWSKSYKVILQFKGAKIKVKLYPADTLTEDSSLGNTNDSPPERNPPFSRNQRRS